MQSYTRGYKPILDAPWGSQPVGSLGEMKMPDLLPHSEVDNLHRADRARTTRDKKMNQEAIELRSAMIDAINDRCCPDNEDLWVEKLVDSQLADLVANNPERFEYLYAGRGELCFEAENNWFYLESE